MKNMSNAKNSERPPPEIGGNDGLWLTTKSSRDPWRRHDRPEPVDRRHELGRVTLVQGSMRKSRGSRFKVLGSLTKVRATQGSMTR